MFNSEDEKKAWKTLLENGQISEETYYKEIKRIDGKILYENHSNSINIANVIPKIIIGVSLLCVALLAFNSFKVYKPIEKVESLKNISEPVQSYTSGSVQKIIDGKNININYIASYSISGKVVDVQKYYGYKTQNKLSPIDVGIVWGFLAECSDKLTWTSNGTRFLRWRPNDMTWYSKVGGEKAVSRCLSNNHVIPSDENIEKLIKNIKKDDYVKIEGYLVNVRYDEPDGSWFMWSSSTTRDDDGDGACELIYVTGVTWLEEK